MTLGKSNKRHYAECRILHCYAVRHYAEWHYDEWRYAECRGSVKN
jgi:hypothetical protein